MNAYTAHIVAFIKFIDGEPQQIFPVYENIVLIYALSDDEAWKEAERIGVKRYDGSSVEREGRAGTWTFGGVRRLVTWIVRNESLRDASLSVSMPNYGHGTEVTYLQFEFGSEQDFQAYMHGEPVNVLFEE